MPVIQDVKTIREGSGHDGHAEATVYVALCPDGRIVTVTCLETGCRVDRPARDEANP